MRPGIRADTWWRLKPATALSRLTFEGSPNRFHVQLRKGLPDEIHRSLVEPVTMSTLEVIHLRSSSEPVEILADSIRESLRDLGRDEGTFTIYRRDTLATDLALHIRHQTDDARVPSRLGLNLVSALASFGLVKHSVWCEMSDRPANDHTSSE